MEAAGSTTVAARGKLLSGASTAIIIEARNDAGARSECLFRRLRFKLPDDHISYSMGCHDGCDGRHFNCVPDSSFAENPEHLCAWTVDGKGRRAVGLGALDVETVPIKSLHTLQDKFYRRLHRHANRRAVRLGRSFNVTTMTGVSDLPTEDEAAADQRRDAERRAREQQGGGESASQGQSFRQQRRAREWGADRDASGAVGAFEARVR